MPYSVHFSVHHAGLSWVPYSVLYPVPYSVRCSVPFSVHYSVRYSVPYSVRCSVCQFIQYITFDLLRFFSCGGNKKVPPGSIEDSVRGGYPPEHHGRDRLRHFPSGAQAQR